MLVLSELGNIGDLSTSALYQSEGVKVGGVNNAGVTGGLPHQLEGTVTFPLTPQQKDFQFALNFYHPDLQNGGLSVVEKGDVQFEDDGCELLPPETLYANLIVKKVSIRYLDIVQPFC